MLFCNVSLYYLLSFETMSPGAAEVGAEPGVLSDSERHRARKNGSSQPLLMRAWGDLSIYRIKDQLTLALALRRLLF